MPAAQRFTLTVGGHEHEVEVVAHAVRRTVTWRVDDAQVATKTTADDSFAVKPHPEHAEAGRLEMRFTALGRPRRATWHPADAGDPLGRDGIDLEPEMGSPAAAYAERLAAHPTRFTLVQTGLGVLKVVLPILLGALVVRFAVALPWPSIDLPSIPLPSVDLPSIPWPDWHLPSIPWPDWHLPDWHAPAWLAWILAHAHYVWPVILAFVLARAELRRRRQQEERRAARTAQRPSDAG